MTIRDQFMKGLSKMNSRFQIPDSRSSASSPHILHLWFPGHKAEDLLVRLDLNGVAISAGPACGARSSRPSHVLEAMGFTAKRAAESIRVSFGAMTTTAEVRRAMTIFEKILK
jgi:cysteine desulfurase